MGSLTERRPALRTLAAGKYFACGKLDVWPATCFTHREKEQFMSSTSQELKDKMTTDFEAGKKAFHDAMAKAQSQIDVATTEVNKLRADLKTQTAEAKAKTKARIG